MENITTSPFWIRDIEALRAISDPLRLRIVAALADGARSVKELASSTGVAATKLYYHVDILLEHGFLVVESTRLVSGITEKHYRAASRDLRVDRKLLACDHPDETLDGLLTAVLDAARAEAERSSRAGALAVEDDPGSPRAGLFSRTQARVTREQAASFRAELDDLIERVEANAPRGEDALRYELTIAYFPLPDGA